MINLSKMEKLISRKINIQCVPDSYVQPPELRPGHQVIPVFKNVPIIDLRKGTRKEIVAKIIDACQEYGFFQAINHGVADELMQHMMNVAKDFFEKPVLEDMARCYSDDPAQGTRLYTSAVYNKEKVHCWRDTLRLSCDPLEDCIQSWPLKPTPRKVAVEYAMELRKLSLWILDVIAEGIGFKEEYFTNLNQAQIMALNHYPSCPDPSVTIGINKHADLNLITILQQEENLPGLQALINDRWYGVEPIPNAFVVDIGVTLQVICNGKLKAYVHRAVTNKIVSRTSIATGINPSSDAFIEPAKSMVNAQNPARYRGFVFKDLFTSFVADSAVHKPPMERYEINPS